MRGRPQGNIQGLWSITVSFKYCRLRNDRETGQNAGGFSFASFCAHRNASSFSICEIGEAKITRGYALPCKYVIHTVSPVWHGTATEKEQLVACYRNALTLAVQHHCTSIAFPLIASGAHGCPKAEALHIATDTINAFLLQHVPDNDLTVYLVMFTKESLQVGSKLFADIRQYIDDHYVEEHYDRRREQMRMQRASLNCCSAWIDEEIAHRRFAADKQTNALICSLFKLF